MRIAYYLYWLDGIESGVVKKIIAQTDIWKSKGNQTKIFLLTKRNSEFEQDFQVKDNTFNVEIEVFSFTSSIDRINKSYKILHAVLKYNPSILYMRETSFLPGIYSLTRKIPAIVEINSLSMEEKKVSFSKLFDEITFRLKFKYVSGIVSVTNEISNHSSIKRLNKPRTVIANGYDLKDTSLSKDRVFRENTGINLVFIGSDGQPWHGVDKILKLARVKGKWKFHIIGINRKKFERLDISPNVKFYGKLEKKEYLEIYKDSNIAISTLALHRKKLNEATSLKTREYLAYGLPVILGYKDVDFLEETPFICRLPNTENNVVENLEKIETFVNSWKNKRVSMESIRHIGADYKEINRLSFFEKILAK